MALPIVMQFARAPVAGQVKTRLQPALSVEKALQLHEWMINRVVENCCRPKLWRYQLWVAGEVQHSLFRQLAHTFSVELRQQAGDTLGARMAGALYEAQRDDTVSILIGSDCPLLSSDYLQQALHAIEQGNEVVIGPAEDGGYVLLACRGYFPQLFEAVDWGTDQVLPQTRQRLQQSRMSWFELPMLWDIDRIEDLRRYQQQQSLSFLD